MTVLTLEDAFLLHQKGQLREAIKAYQSIIASDEEEQAKLNELTGIAYAQLRELETALPYFQKALKLRPHYLSIQNNLATCYKKLGKRNKAIQLYLNILKGNPFQCVTMNNLATLYIASQDNDKAILLLKKAITLQPLYADAYFNLGLIDNPKYFKKAFELGNNAAAYHYGLFLETQEEAIDAKHYYEQAVQRIENHALSHHGLARVLLALGEDEEALFHFIKAQGIDPYIPHLMENIAAYYHAKGMHANAVEYWLKSLDLTEDRIEVLYNIGVAYHYMNRHDDALHYFHMVLESSPNHVNTHINIAAIALQNNQRQVAITHYGKVLELDPENEEVRYILSALKKESHGFKASPKQYVTNLFDQYAGHYDQHLMNLLKYQLPKKVELLIYEHYKPRSDKRILDLGCGTGLLGPILQPFAKELIGVDLSPNMLSQARKTQRYHQLIEMDALSYLEQTKSFDMILALELCPYIGDIEPLLQAIRQKLDGLFIFSIESTDKESYTLSEHARYQHNPQWVKSVLKKHGFQIIDEEATTLRLQNTKPVSGYLFSVEKMPA